MHACYLVHINITFLNVSTEKLEAHNSNQFMIWIYDWNIFRTSLRSITVFCGTGSIPQNVHTFALHITLSIFTTQHLLLTKVNYPYGNRVSKFRWTYPKKKKGRRRSWLFKQSPCVGGLEFKDTIMHSPFTWSCCVMMVAWISLVFVSR